MGGHGRAPHQERGEVRAAPDARSLSAGSAFPPTETAVRPGAAVVVTGGGHGFGRAYCRAFASAGARVVVADLDGGSARTVAVECEALGAEALAVTVDVADEASVAALAEAVRARFGGADVLVNNAAVFATVPLRRAGVEGLSVAEWDRVMEVNVRGSFLCARALVPQMRARGGGRIVNVSSGTAFHGGGAPFHYVTSKAAVIGLTRALARELGRDGITVNAVAPGATPTEATTDEERERQGLTVAARSIPRLEAPDDLVGAVLFLASPAASFITGQTLVVDGGRVMH